MIVLSELRWGRTIEEGKVSCWGVLAFMGALLIAGVSWALNPAVNCEAAKLREAAKYGYCCLKAESDAVKKGEPVDYNKCAEKFNKKWPLLEKRGQGLCPTSGEQAAMNTEIAEHCDRITVILAGDTPPGCQLPATGQTTTYSTDKNDGIPGVVTLPDDGTIQAGAALSYVDHGDGTISDLTTGLMWEKKSDDGGLHDRHNYYYWSGIGAQETVWDWLDDMNTEGGTGFAGYTDWRIPSIRELQSIVDFERSAPCVRPVFNTDCLLNCTVTTCSCTRPFFYWSSTTYLGSPVFAWGVNFSDGAVSTDYKYNHHQARAVRGGL
jgi:hypothetical protein